MKKTQHQFPILEPGLEMTLSQEPVFLDGMKVLFDVTAGLYPVRLTKKEKNKKGKSDNVSLEKNHKRTRRSFRFPYR